MPFGFIGAIIGGASFAAAATAITVVGALEVTAAVGAVLGVVGKVTKNPILSDIGIGLGVIGAVGALAGAAGLLGSDVASGASLFGTASATPGAAATPAAGGFAGGLEPSAVTGATSGSSDGIIDPATFGETGATGSAVDGGTAAANAASPALNMADNSGLPPDQISGVVGSQPVAPTGATTPAPATSNNLELQAVAQPTPATPTVPPPASMEPGDLPVPPQPPGNVGTTNPLTGQNVTSGLSINPTTNQLESINPGGGGVLNNLLDFAKANPVVALGALQAGGSLLSGLTSSLTPAQVSALNSQANANNAAAALQNQQTANLAAPKAVASSAPVTGSPATLVPGASSSTAQPTQQAALGLINTTAAPTPTPSAPVTGANA